MINNKIFLELIKKSLNVFVLRVLSILLGFLFTYFIAKFYGADGMGYFVLCQSILMISILISLFGTDIASVKFISKYFSKNDYSKIKFIYLSILKTVVPISILLALFIYIFRFNFSGSIFNKPDLEVGIIYSAFCIFPLCLVYVHSESLRGMKEVELYTILKYILIPLFSIIFLFILYENDNIYIPLVAYCISIFLTSIISFFIWSFKSRIFKSKIHHFSYEKILKFSFPFFISSSMLLLLQWIDIILLGYFESSSEIGIYSVTVKISMFCSIILFAINSIVAPKISEFFSQKKVEELNEIIKNSSKLMFFSTIPILIIILFSSHFILDLFGKEFLDGEKCLQMLILGQFFNVLCGSVGYILNMTENQNIFRNVTVFAVIVNIIVNIILIPRYGIFGAAVASAISLILWNTISCVCIYKKFNISTIWFIK